MSRMRRALVTAWETEPVFIENKMRYLNYQQEKCPTSGKLHWQIYVEFLAQITLAGIKKIFGKSCHVEQVIIDNGASVYCLKDETAIDGTRREFGEKAAEGRAGSNNALYKRIREAESWDDVLEMEGVSRQFAWAREVFNRKPVKMAIKETLRDWQQAEFDALQQQDDRTVRFVVDVEGGKGKTELARYIVEKLDAFYCTGGKTTDIMCAYDGQAYVVFDLARCTDQDWWPFQCMEFFKNGMGFSPKYQSTTKRFTPAKVLVLCNQYPAEGKLSADRLSVTEL